MRLGGQVGAAHRLQQPERHPGQHVEEDAERQDAQDVRAARRERRPEPQRQTPMREHEGQQQHRHEQHQQQHVILAQQSPDAGGRAGERGADRGEHHALHRDADEQQPRDQVERRAVISDVGQRPVMRQHEAVDIDQHRADDVADGDPQPEAEQHRDLGAVDRAAPHRIAEQSARQPHEARQLQHAHREQREGHRRQRRRDERRQPRCDEHRHPRRRPHEIDRGEAVLAFEHSADARGDDHHRHARDQPAEGARRFAGQRRVGVHQAAEQRVLAEQQQRHAGERERGDQQHAGADRGAQPRLPRAAGRAEFGDPLRQRPRQPQIEQAEIADQHPAQAQKTEPRGAERVQQQRHQHDAGQHRQHLPAKVPPEVAAALTQPGG